MKQNIHTPNIKDARAEFMTLRNGVAVHKQTDMFSPYSPAWLITNEDIRWVSGTTSDEAKRVLTVCGSGDHPIFYAMNGAQNVDTFDLSFCAKALMDIKTTAIQKMSYEDYVPFLYDLYYKTPDELPTLQRMLGDMPRDTAYFIKNMGNCMMFSHACNPDSYKEHLPTAREYAQIQRKIHKPFNFIWSDLCQVNTKLTGEYDVINLSNILDYIQKPETVHNILETMGKRLRPGGWMIAQNGGFGISKHHNTYYTASKKFESWARIGTLPKEKNKANTELIAVLQRVR